LQSSVLEVFCILSNIQISGYVFSADFLKGHLKEKVLLYY